MSVESNKALIYHIYSELNKGNHDVIDECFCDDFVSYREEGNSDRNAFKQFLVNMDNGFPDIQRKIQDLIVTEDRAALYFTWIGTDNLRRQGRTPTGKLIKVKEIYFISFKDGKVSEYRHYSEPHHMAQQLGVKMPDDPPVTRE